MKIPLLSIMIISLCSGIVIYVSMQVGVLLAKVVSPQAASSIGAVILLLMGCWSLIQMLIQKEKEEQHPAGQQAGEKLPLGISVPETVAVSGTVPGSETAGEAENEKQKAAVFSLELRHLGVVIQILRTPSSADMDASGSISSMEAMLLGIALSLDAFGAGLGAALLGFSPVSTSLMIALFSGTFLLLGMRTGLKLSGRYWMKHAAVLPALLLITMGIMKLL